MKQYKLFNHKTLKRLRKFYLMFLGIGFGLVLILFSFSFFNNAFARFVKTNMFILCIFAFLLSYIGTSVWTIIGKGPARFFTLADETFDVIEKGKKISYPYLGLTYVEIDRVTESPAVLVSFVYNEENKVNFILHHSFINEIKECLIQKNINVIE